MGLYIFAIILGKYLWIDTVFDSENLRSQLKNIITLYRTHDHIVEELRGIFLLLAKHTVASPIGLHTQEMLIGLFDAFAEVFKSFKAVDDAETFSAFVDAYQKIQERQEAFLKKVPDLVTDDGSSVFCDKNDMIS